MERVLPSRERCGDVALLNAALDALEALPVVDGRTCFKEQHNNGVGRIHVNLWCRGEHAQKKAKQPYVDLTKGDAVPTYQVAAEKLLALVTINHAGCLAAAEAAKAKASGVRDGEPHTGSNAPSQNDPQPLLPCSHCLLYFHSPHSGRIPCSGERVCAVPRAAQAH